MSPELKRLKTLQPPPEHPVGTSSLEPWEEIEARVGAHLPSDYKEYVASYGAGRWADFLGIMTPFYKWKHPEGVDYVEWSRTRLRGLDQVHVDFPEFAPPFYEFPARDGLLPIGYTDNGGTICWQTAGAPDNWGVVVLAEEYPLGYDKFETSLTGFLVGLLERRLVPSTFPRDFFPIPTPAFIPYTTQ
jgi:hypothetical protein